MAFDQGSKNDIGTQPATADLSAKQYFCVAFDSSTGVSLVAAAGAKCDGILQNAPIAGQAAQVRTSGLSKAIAAEAITAGAEVESDANGKLVNAVKGTVSGSNVVGGNIVGTAVTACTNAGDIITINIAPRGTVATTAA